MKRIIVTGANGQLGRELQELAAAFPHFDFFFCTRTELDISNPESVAATFASYRPHYCINCAAYTAVDKAETEQAAAFAINAAGVRHLAAASAAHQAKLVHISTDYVFNGRGSQPYTEDHPTDPVNTYGRSKLQGEQEALEAHPDTVVIRTSWVYSAYGNNFVKTMLRLMKERPSVGVVADQQGSPTYAADLAQAVLQIISSGRWQPGIYHFTNAGEISWFDFADAIRVLTKASCTVQALTTEQYPTPAKRPAYSVMDTTKISQTYGVRPVPWKESLAICLARLAAGR